VIANDKLHTIPEFAALREVSAAGYSVSTIRRRVEEKEIRPVSTTGKKRGKKLYREGDLWAALGDSADSAKEMAFSELMQCFSIMKDTFRDLEQDIAENQKQLETLARWLSHKPHPYGYWSEMFDEIAEALGRIDSSEALKMMGAHGNTLRLRALLEGDLRVHITKVRDSGPDKEDASTTDAIRAFRDRVLHWDGFAMEWGKFRLAATNCFDTSGAVTREKYGELSHMMEVWYVDPDSGRRTNWNAMLALVSSPKLMNSIAGFIAESIVRLGWNFDSFCQMSAGGHGLAQLLALRMDKRLLAIDNRTHRFLPAKADPEWGHHLVLVDTVIQSGKHLEDSISQAKKDGREVKGAVFLARNDGLEDPDQDRGIVDRMQAKGQLLYCFALSTLPLPRARPR
jgi:hypothetical protein